MEGVLNPTPFIEMGFSVSKVNEAMAVTGGGRPEDVVTWLLEHPDYPEDFAEVEDSPMDNVTDDKIADSEVSVKSDDDADANESCIEDPGEACSKDSEMPTNEPKPGCSYETKNDDDDDKSSQVVRSIRCEVCGRHLRPEEVEYHAIKTSHSSFTESAEEIKPMTEEEKQEAIKKVQDLIKQRRIAQAEKTKKEEIERERNRRRAGQEMTSARQRLAEAEMKSLAELKRKEKCEALMARQRVLQQIERDKQERREKFGTPKAVVAPIKQPDVQVEQPKKNYTECRLQIRLTNGECLVQTFKANEELAAVRLYVELNRTDGDGPFVFKTTFPKRVFTEEDMAAPLSELDLLPTAVLIVSKPS